MSSMAVKLTEMDEQVTFLERATPESTRPFRSRQNETVWLHSQLAILAALLSDQDQPSGQSARSGERS
jgi:hypothetical protein